MNTSLARQLRLFVVAAVLVPCTGGCACWNAWSAPCHGGPLSHAYGDGFISDGHLVGWHGPSMCYGYYPTCWRPWPLECPPCPPFALAPTGGEVVKPPAVAAPDLPPVVEAPPAPAPDTILVPPETPTPAPPPGIQLPEPPLPPAPMPDQESSSRRRWTKGQFIARPGEAPDELLLR